jgi:hypothetical protein
MSVLVTRLLLVSQYPGDVDPALYVLSIEQIANPSRAVSFIFNQEMSFGYYAFISLIYRIFDFDISQLVAFVNYLSAFSGTILILIFGLLMRRLVGGRTAVLGMLILLLNHSLWNWSLYGHPIISSVGLFFLSLYTFDKSLVTSDEVHSETYPRQQIKRAYAFLSGLFALASLLIRVDILFVFFAFFLLSKYRRGRVDTKVLGIFYGSVFSVYLILKIIFLGYIVAPRGGIVVLHASRLFRFRDIPSALIVNLGLISAGIGIFFILLALIAIFKWIRMSSQYFLPLILTISPVFILVFFKNIDFPRHSISIHPFLAFFAALAFMKITSTLKKNFVWGIGAIVSVYILQTALVYYPMKELWARKYPPSPSVPMIVRPVPIGEFFTDRARRHEDERRLNAHAIFLSRQTGDILVICSRLHSSRMAVALLQHCSDASLELDKKAFGTLFKISRQNTSFLVVSRDRYRKDILPDLFNSKEYLGFAVYFLNNLQTAYPVVAIPNEYKYLTYRE